MLIFGYVRQSSVEQVKWGYNLEEQERQIRDYCDYHYKDFELIIYTDAGKSGTNMKRPQLQKLLKDCRTKKPNVVVFHNIDRLSRELNDLWHMIKFFTANNISLVSVLGYIDLTTAYGKGNVLNEGLSAMIESMKISDRTIRALKQGVFEGKYPFSGCPIGYKKIDKKLYISDNEHDVELIKYIFDNVSKNKCNIKYLRKEIINKFNVSHTTDTIIKIVKNPIYTGSISYKGIDKDNYCEPIISKEIYEKANANLLIKKKKHMKTNYIFKNKCYCKTCKTYMIQTAGTSKYKKMYAYYNCPKCHRNVSQVKILSICCADLFHITMQYTENKSEFGKIKNEITKNKQELEKLVLKQQETPINVDDFFAIYNNTSKNIKDLEYKLKDKSIKYSKFNDLPFTTQRDIVNTCIERIDITFNKKSYTIKILSTNNIKDIV